MIAHGKFPVQGRHGIGIPFTKNGFAAAGQLYAQFAGQRGVAGPL